MSRVLVLTLIFCMAVLVISVGPAYSNNASDCPGSAGERPIDITIEHHLIDYDGPPPEPRWKALFHLMTGSPKNGLLSLLNSTLLTVSATLPWSPASPSAIQNDIVNIVKNIPNSPEVFQYLPGYAKFRGVLVSGEDGGRVSVGGSTEISGGVYANGSVSLKEGAVITEDSYYLSGIIDHFLPILPGVPSRLNILRQESDSVIPSNPVNLRKLPKRAHIINSYEISPLEAVSAGLPQ